ncbi:MAG: MarR family winged helix-turn-helix transcriptional regulator, partial [Chitinophagales bacterium]
MTNRSLANNSENSQAGSAERIVAELRKAHRGVHALFSQLSEVHGITMPQVIVLKTLAKAGCPLTLVGLAGQLDLAKSTVSVEVDRMVRAGYLLREPDPGCRRQVRIQ